MSNTYDIPKELEEMLFDFYSMPSEKKYVSDYWIHKFNNARIAHLASAGYKNFRHTVAMDYCAWYDNPFISETPALTRSRDFLLNNLRSEEIAYAKKVARKIPSSLYANKEFNLITLLLWQYVKNQGLEQETKQLSESAEGLPPAINFNGRLISQSLAYSLLEYHTLRESADIGAIDSIMSIGPGYGRTTYVLKRLLDIKKCIFIDIPPALYIAQRYWETLYPEKRIFKYRKFASFQEIEKEFKGADIVFLMPWQIKAIPAKSVDLVLAVDSFDEMNMKRIKSYLKHISVLGKRYFYMKCMKERESEDGVIKWEDYPIPTDWKCLVDRECKVQTNFCELLCQLP